MKLDPPVEAFLGTAHEDFETIRRDGDAVRMLAFPREPAEGYPFAYEAVFSDIEHLVRSADGTVRVSSDPVACTIRFPEDYLHATDRSLIYRVVRMSSPIFHPNVHSGAGTADSTGGLCLGTGFRPGTRLRALVFQLHRIIASRSFATESPLDLSAAEYYVAHTDQIRGLKARPLWRARLATNIKVEQA